MARLLDESELRELLLRVQSWSEAAKGRLSPPSSLVETALASALVRLPGLLRGILLLLGNALPLEADVLLRTLVEIGITTTWIGIDEERAALWRNDSARKLRAWLDDMAKQGSPLPPEPASALAKMLGHAKRPGMPSLEQRAKAIDTTVYSYAYRRVSAAAHGEHRLFHLTGLGHGDGDPQLTAQDAALSASVLLLALAGPLLLPDAKALAEDVIGKMKHAITEG